LIPTIIENLEKVRKSNPLIHHITNYVTVNDCANITLQIGGLPVMADAIEEVAEMQQIANALVLNIGTLNSELVKSMIAAGQKANSLGHPVILDPVGAGATSMRTKKVNEILANVEVDIITGNLAEIGILVGLEATVRGVEAGEVSGDIMTGAQNFAEKHQTTIAVTGEQDMVINSEKTAIISNGHLMMAKISGTGCMCSSILGAFAAASDDMLQAAVAGLTCFGIAGELAALTNPPGPLAYKTALMDCVYGLNADLINKHAQVKML
jgi:hydroxyethylthiazole kinase